MATKATITKVLSCALVFVILMSVMPVSVFAVNDSNNSTGNVSNRSNELVNSFMVNNSAEVMIPLFNNNITDNYRAWSEEDNGSGDCVPIPDANMPVIYLSDTQESVVSQDSGNDTDATILHDISNDTARTVSALSCSVYIKIDDDTCVGYEVYVDGVYKLTEGEGGTPDGYCAFYVSAGTHTIEIRKNGRSASISKNFECGYTYRWVSMPDYWCENGDHGDEVKFRGIVTDKAPEGMTGGYWWDVKVDEWISGSMPCDIIKVRFLVMPDVPIGSYDLSIRIGDYVEAYGSVYPNECSVGLNGESYYIKKISSELLSINVWTDKSEYKIGETVTIYYKTNKKCTAKLTITKPDGGDVVYGPNEIPASTRSKSATAGYPTGKRTVVFEAWAGAEYKKATCYFDVVDEEEWEVKFQATVNSTYPEETYFICEVRVDKIISDPDDCIDEGWIVDIVLEDSPCGSYEEVKKGDKIEVFGKRLLVYSFPPQISLCGKSSYYLKKIDSKTLSISVWTDKSEYKIGETVTIYYKTNKKCTAKLTITKPDGGDVVYGPNEIPASTRSKSSTAGYPTGKRTVVFEAWDGDEYKKATCYFDVVDEEECEVKFRGIVMDIRGTTPWVQVDKVISGSEYISVGDYADIACYTTAGETGPCGHCDIVKKGDRVEVYGKRLPIYQIPMVISICGKTSYYMRMIGKPDLVIQDISLSPSKPKQGDTVTINVKTKNQGSKNAEGFYVCYYVDGSYYTRDYISSLSAGSTTTTSFTWTAECGSHSIKAYADCDGTIDESNEGNNEKSIIISIPLGEKNAKIKGRVTNILYPISFPPVYKIEIQEIQEDPLNKFNVGDEVSVSYPWDTQAQIDSEIKAGDRVEVVGGENYECGYDLYLVELDHYIKRIPVKTIYVDDDFVVDEPSNHKWTTIQKGIKDANDGDTILVYPGTYTENVEVTKSLTIKSTSGNPEDTIVQAKDLYDAGFEVTADDVEISGFTVKGAGAGISLNRTNHCNISNNIASNNDCYGIFLEYSDNNNITNNNASLNKGEGGIALHFSNENTLMNNDILNNAYGIELYHSNSNVLTNNIVKSNNEAGHFIGCIFLVHSSNNVFTNNNVLNNNVGINLDSSSNYNSIYHNNFRDNGKSPFDRSGTNIWDCGYPSGGNYWSDYDEKSEGAVDEKSGPKQDQPGSDGIVDTPYDIIGDAGAKDNYPLIEPWKRASWTYMAYLDGDETFGTQKEDLGKEMDRALNEMEEVGSTRNVKIIVLIDRLGDCNSALYYVTKDKDTKTINSEKIDLEKLGLGKINEVNMGNHDTLASFIKFVKREYPAERYALVLSDHGGGIKGVCWDDTSNDHLFVYEISQALEKADIHIDVLAFEACLMSTIEVAYQVKDYADFMVASEDRMMDIKFPSVHLFPHNKILDYLASNPEVSGSRLAQVMFEKIKEEYDGISPDWLATISAIDLSKIESLADATSDLAQSLREGLDETRLKKIKDIRRSIASTNEEYGKSSFLPVRDHFYDTDLIDLYYFAELVESEFDNRTIKHNAVKVMNRISKLAVRYEWHRALHWNTHGISIYFPEYNCFLSYTTFPFKVPFRDETHWGDFLDEITSEVTIFCQPEPVVKGPQVWIRDVGIEWRAWKSMAYSETTSFPFHVINGECAIGVPPTWDNDGHRLKFHHWEEMRGNGENTIISTNNEFTFDIDEEKRFIAVFKPWRFKWTKSIKASLDSPANLHAYDSQGRHVGMNATGGFDLQIPNSYYTGPDAEPEEIVIFGQSENIKFKVEALEEGKFNLTITQSTKAETKKISYNDVPIAETTEATVDVSEANPTYIMEIDDDGDGTTDRKREPEPIDVIRQDSYSIQLHTGWNLISLPLTPEDTNVLNVLSPVADNWNSVWSYEGGKWKRYDLTGPDFLNTLTFMEPGKGYWLHMNSDDTLSISGSEPRVKSIPLSAGWNLVGYYSLNSMPTTEAMSSVAGNWNSVWSYEAGRWKRYDLTGPSFLNTLTFMEPGKGYWLNMKSPDTWTLGA